MTAIKSVQEIFSEVYDYVSCKVYNRIFDRVGNSIYNPIIEFKYSVLYDDSFNDIMQNANKIHTLDDIEDILATKLDTYTTNDATRRNHRTNK